MADLFSVSPATIGCLGTNTVLASTKIIMADLFSVSPATIGCLGTNAILATKDNYGWFVQC